MSDSNSTSHASRKLQAGAKVVTDYSGRLTVHTIVERIDGCRSQSGIMFRLFPPVPKSSGGAIDADWFTPF